MVSDSVCCFQSAGPASNLLTRMERSLGHRPPARGHPDPWQWQSRRWQLETVALRGVRLPVTVSEGTTFSCSSRLEVIRCLIASLMSLAPVVSRNPTRAFPIARMCVAIARESWSARSTRLVRFGTVSGRDRPTSVANRRGVRCPAGHCRGPSSSRNGMRHRLTFERIAVGILAAHVARALESAVR